MRNSKPKLFVLSEHICVDENSTGYFWSKLIEKLHSKIGCINVIAPEQSMVGGGVDQSIGVNYIFFRVRKSNKNKLLSRFYGQLRQVASFVIRVSRNVNANDLVLSGTNPALLLMVMPIARMIWKFKWVVLVHDVFPDNLVPAGIVSKASITFFLLNRYSNWLYSKADLLVAIGRDMQEVLIAKTKSESRICYIPNWVDGAEIRPIHKEESKLIQLLGWQGKTVFQFFGNIGRVQGVDNILQAIKLVKSQDAAFLFIGGGAKVEDVKRFIAENPMCNVRYFGGINQSEKNQGLGACDVAIVSLEKGMFGLGVPSKAYFSMAADRPLLAIMDKGSEIALMVDEFDVGWHCEPARPDLLASLFDDICSEVKRLPAKNPRKIFQDKFSDQLLTEKFAAKIKNLMV